MRPLVAAIGVLVAVCALCPAYARWASYAPAQDPAKAKEIAQLTKELQRVKLGQIAIFIESRSEGASRLVIKSGASAGPEVIAALRAAQPSWGDIPFMSVYPASSPVSLKLEGIGDCEVLGAVALLPQAVAAECDDKDKDAVAQPGVYLIAWHLTDGWIEEAVLLSLTADDEGRAKLGPVLRTLAKRSMNVSSLAPPAASVKFPKPEDVSKAILVWRASVTILSPQHMYEFELDLRIAPVARTILPEELLW